LAGLSLFSKATSHARPIAEQAPLLTIWRCLNAAHE
jgi:hypothetical protein